MAAIKKIIAKNKNIIIIKTTTLASKTALYLAT